MLVRSEGFVLIGYLLIFFVPSGNHIHQRFVNIFHHCILSRNFVPTWHEVTLFILLKRERRVQHASSVFVATNTILLVGAAPQSPFLSQVM